MVDFVRINLYQGGVDGDILKYFVGNSVGGNVYGGFVCGGLFIFVVVVNVVFGIVGEICMIGVELVFDFGIVFGLLIGVLYYQRDWCVSSFLYFVFVDYYIGEDFDFVWFVLLGGVF